MPTRDPAFTKELHGRLPPVHVREHDAHPPGRRGVPPKGPLALALVGALVGAVFSGLSTSDFMQHLDRQVHAIHCSFIPGVGKEITESGCRTVMMSPYSSFFRETLWGGIPVSLWAMAVFAFLAYRAGLVLWRGRTTSGEMNVLLAATTLPVAMSLVYGALSVYKLDALCKVCIGIYAASALCFLGALLARRAEGTPYGEARFAPALTEGTVLVAALTLAYVLLAPRPDPRTSLQGCGSLVRAEDTAGVMIPLASNPGRTASIEVLDPLCPSCKAFDARLTASALGDRLDLKAVLFPLDSSCNWMVTEAIHPGACAVSEAVLCAAGVGPGPKNADAAGAVLKWAFARQAELRALAARSEGALRARIEQEIPSVKGCLGGPLVKSKLTKSLRWAVANAVPVLTPQLFVAGTRLCDEDTDLGLEYTLSRMLSPEAEAERARTRVARPPPPHLAAEERAGPIAQPASLVVPPPAPSPAQNAETRARPAARSADDPLAVPATATQAAPVEVGERPAPEPSQRDSAARPSTGAGASDEESTR